MTVSEVKTDSSGTGAATNPVTVALKELPESELAPLSGTVTMTSEKDGYPAELVAYSSLDEAVSNIAVTVKRLEPGRVLVVEDRALLHSFWGYQSVSAEVTRQADALHQALAVLGAPRILAAPDAEGTIAGLPEGLSTLRVAPPEAGNFLSLLSAMPAPASFGSVVGAGISLLGAAPAVIGTVADVVGMFRTNYSLSGRVMTPQGTPLVAEVARALCRRDVAAVVDGFHLAAPSPLLEQISDAQKLRRQVAATVAEQRAQMAARQARIKRLEAEVASVLASCLKVAEKNESTEQLDVRLAVVKSELSDQEADVAIDVGRVAFADAVTAGFDAFLTAVMTAPGDGMAPIIGAVMREALGSGGGVTHVLFVSLDSVGAETVTTEARFGRDGEVRYVGGLQVTHMVADVATGETVGAGTTQWLTRVTYDLENGQMRGRNTVSLGREALTD